MIITFSSYRRTRCTRIYIFCSEFSDVKKKKNVLCIPIGTGQENVLFPLAPLMKQRNIVDVWQCIVYGFAHLPSKKIIICNDGLIEFARTRRERSAGPQTIRPFVCYSLENHFHASDPRITIYVYQWVRRSSTIQIRVPRSGHVSGNVRRVKPRYSLQANGVWLSSLFFTERNGMVPQWFKNENSWKFVILNLKILK